MTATPTTAGTVPGPVPGSADAPTDRVLTIPNGLSVLRLLGVPLFLYLALGPERDGLAVVVLIVSGITDFLDGKLARRWNQSSKLGALLDPAADRLYIVSTLIALAVRGVVPVWFTVALLLRDVALFAFVPALRKLHLTALPVHFLGKAATFNLLYALPLLLLGAGHHGVRDELATICRPIGWGFAIWGAVLYWYSVVLYGVQVRQLQREAAPDVPA